MTLQLHAFSETCLLHRHVLSVICPMESKPFKFQQEANMGPMQTIAKAAAKAADIAGRLQCRKTWEGDLDNVEPYYGSEADECTLPVRVITSLLRVVIVATVTTVAAPVGAVVHSGLACYSLCDWGWCWLHGDETETARNRTSHHASAIANDALCFISVAFDALLTGGSVVLAFMAVSLMGALPPLWPVAVLGMGIAAFAFAVGVRNLSLLSPSATLASIMRCPGEERDRLYFALEVRRQLGCVDQNGELLRYRFQTGEQKNKGTEQGAWAELKLQLNALVSEQNHSKIPSTLKCLESF